METLNLQDEIDKIKILKARYLAFMDAGPDGRGPYADGLIKLFTNDAVLGNKSNK